MTLASKTQTRHKERYSLALTGLVAAVLLFVSTPSSFPALLVINIMAIVSILYSASSVVRHADVLAHRFGEPFGSLILSLSIVALEVSLISILMLSGYASETLVRDTIFGVLMIVMTGFIGFALLIGGYKYGTQNFNSTGIKHYLVSMMPLSLLALGLPTFMGDGTLSTGQLVVISLGCLLTYGVFLHVQTITHRDFFIHEDEDEDDNHHGKPSTHSNARHFAMLAVHLVAVVGVTKLNTTALEALFAVLDAPPRTAGLLVAMLVLSPEGTGAFYSVLRNQTQRAMNLFLGSVVATISLTVPVVAVIATISGQRMLLGLSTPEIFLLLTTFLVCQMSLTSGASNAHSGSAHILLFMIYLILVFAG